MRKEEAFLFIFPSNYLVLGTKSLIEDPELELMWVEIQFFTHRPLLLGCCYRPPNSTAPFFSKLEQVLEKVAEKDILLVGDFNDKHKDWFIGDNTNCNGQTLKDLMDRFDMTQLCSEATHLDNNGEPSSLLDLAFTQGTVLGPVLFLVFINDLPSVMKSFCSIFADDTTAYTIGKDVAST